MRSLKSRLAAQAHVAAAFVVLLGGPREGLVIRVVEILTPQTDVLRHCNLGHDDGVTNLRALLKIN